MNLRNLFLGLFAMALFAACGGNNKNANANADSTAVEAAPAVEEVAAPAAEEAAPADSAAIAQ